MSDEFYLPNTDAIKPQSADNRQGRAGDLSDTSTTGVQWMMRSICEMAYDAYRILLGERTGRDPRYPNELLYDPYAEGDPLLDDDYPGIARELARTVLPVAYYTECYWQQNLHNLFHLWTDPHTQHETRIVAEAMYSLIKPVFPMACEAYEDYIRDAVTLSRMETQLVKDMLTKGITLDAIDPETFGLTKREMREFKARFGL